MKEERARYVELQVTTHFSFLRGASSPEELHAAASLLGLQAIATTDRNSFAGLVRSLDAQRVTGTRAIVGCRLDLGCGTSLLVYPTNVEAYARLCRLLSLGKARGGKGACILEWSDVGEWCKGLIAILIPDRADATNEAALITLKTMFGPDGYMALTIRRKPRDGRVLLFDPTNAECHSYNPLYEIRRGAQEVRDVQNVADILVDPEGSLEKRNHWEKTSHALLVSDALGTSTEMRAMKNYAGHRLSPWLGHLMVSRTETARALLTPGEVMQLPPDDEIVMLAGLAPIRATKARYYSDRRLAGRVAEPPGLTRREGDGINSVWRDVITPPTVSSLNAESEDDGANSGIRQEPAASNSERALACDRETSPPALCRSRQTKQERSHKDCCDIRKRPKTDGVHTPADRTVSKTSQIPHGADPKSRELDLGYSALRRRYRVRPPDQKARCK